MFDVLTINVTTELFGLIFCLVCISISALSPNIGGTNAKRQVDIRNMFICEAFALFSDAVAGIYRGEPGIVARIAVYIGNFVQFTASYMLFGFYIVFITHSILTEKGRLYRQIAWAAVIFNIIMMIWNLFTGKIYSIDENNIYTRGVLFTLSQFTGLVCNTIIVIFLIRHRKAASKRKLYVLLVSWLMVAVSLIVESFVYGIAWFNIAIMLTLMINFIYNQMSIAESLAEKRKQIAEQQLILEQSRMQIMVSQIKPHFIFNKLTSIAQLCEDSPEEAQQMTIAFANYLRKNMSSLDEIKPIPFSEELEHIRNYLTIEKVRFGDMLEIEYDIETEDFSIPILSVQPIVENAVKHGAGESPEGGTVRIATRETESAYLVIVSDNGQGFDTSLPRKEKSIGLKNVESRLRILNGASFELESEVGRGTKATITIPKNNISEVGK